MQDHPSFKNPPIKEAIIDIKVSEVNVDVENLDLSTEMERSGFSECNPMYSKEFRFKEQGGKMVPDGGLGEALIGFRYDSQEGFVAQFRNNGFTFSKLGSYGGWEEFRSKARQAWTLYHSQIGDCEFKRLAVRFINILALPTDEDGKVDLEDYLVNSPQVPEDMPDTLLNFFSKVDVKVLDPECVAVVSQAPQPPQDGNVCVVLDIDVFRQHVEDFSEELVWDFIERLRDVKNSAFIGSITDKTKELINR